MSDARSRSAVCEGDCRRPDLADTDKLLPMVGWRRRLMGEPFPGPYSWRHHPWVKELHDSWAPFTWAMKGAQLGVTEAAINRAAYTLDSLKRDVLYVLPTSMAASDFSKATVRGGAGKQRVSPVDLHGDQRGQHQACRREHALHPRLRGRGSLKSVPVSELILDELDEMEKDQLWLALERLSGQLHKHVWGISTPTIPDYGIHKLYLGSTQEQFFSSARVAANGRS